MRFKFTSTHRGLTLQDDKGVWAQFEPEFGPEGQSTGLGVFETDDDAVAERLRGVAYVTEVPGIDPAPKKAAAAAGKPSAADS